MATTSSPIRNVKINSRERATQALAESFTGIAAEQDEVHMFNVVDDHSCVIQGLNVSFSATRTFAISAGACLLAGKLIPVIATQSATLDEENTGQPRIDLVEITGVTDTDYSSDNRILLSALVRNAVTGEAVGTGDGTTKAWDLGYERVDPATLKVYVDGGQVGGWNYSKATGSGGVDQILFHEAPTSLLPITADYTHVTGGVESTTSVNTAKRRDPAINVVKGTPAGSPSAPSATAGSVVLATIQVPASWTGGSGSVTITNSVKQWLISPDANVDTESAQSASNANKLSYAVRGVDQVIHGCRLRYVGSTDLAVTAGWGNYKGVAWKLTEEASLDCSSASAGWNYVYLRPRLTSTHRPASTPLIQISTSAPNHYRSEGSGDLGVYVGAFFVASTGPVVIRPFWTHGDWTMYLGEVTADAGGLIYTLAHDTDEDISNAIPATGRLFYGRLIATATGETAGDELRATLRSKRVSGSSDYDSLVATWMHLLEARATLVVLGSTDDSAFGMVRAEVHGGTRKVHASLVEAGSPTSSSATLHVLGYLDDYRTMNPSGSPQDY